MKKALWVNDEGYYSLEAALVFPVILMLTVFLLFFSLYMYEKANLYQEAEITAFRAAAAWNNSFNSPITGGSVPGSNDGLYWRLFANFNDHLTLKEGAADVNARQGATLVQQKLSHAADSLPEHVSGMLSFVNHAVEQHVSVDLQIRTPVSLPFQLFQENPLIHAAAQAYINDPVEIIRNMDFLQMYIPEVKDSLFRASEEQAINSLWDQEVQQPEKLQFSRENPDAQEYLRQSVNGEKVTMSVVVRGKKYTRQIDAVDHQGIAHQAYLGYIANDFGLDANGSKFNAQVEKDLQLLKEGRIKGVVWHFYRSSKTGKVGLSAPLRRSLEKKGIIIVIHD